MFYSHEILTSRKHGVATVWLVATLGAKSTNKKVTKKTLLDVNVPKACKTIVDTEAPMALRLQSRLLFGVSKVFDSQCSYVLIDAQEMENKMRQIIQGRHKGYKLDLEHGRASRPENLLLHDDPSFNPNLAFGNLDFNLLGYETADTAPSSSGIGSIRSSFSARSSQSSLQGVPNIIIPSSPTSQGGAVGEFGGFGGAGTSETGAGGFHELGHDQYGPGVLLEDTQGFLDEADFAFDENGEMYDISTGPARTSLAAASRQNADTTIRGSVGLDQQQASNRIADLLTATVEDDAPPPAVETEHSDVLPRQDTYPALLPGISSDDTSPLSSLPTLSPSSASAPLRRTRAPRKIPLDTRIALPTTDLASWKNNYSANMASALATKEKARLPHLARKNAAYALHGAGIANIATFLPTLAPELHRFVGPALLSFVTRKRPFDDTSSAPSTPRRVRARTSTEHPRAIAADDENDTFAAFADFPSTPPDPGPGGVELGRTAPLPLDMAAGDASSSIMPWNASSVRSRSYSATRGAFPTAAGGGGSVSSGVRIRRPLGRRVSASPLVGRSSAAFLPEETNDDEMEVEVREVEEEGEIPTAEENTKEAEAIDISNFLSFVQDAIADAGTDRVGFWTLLPPGAPKITHVVAAQAFAHLLELCSAGVLVLQQQDDKSAGVLGFSEVSVSLSVGVGI